jgi:NAD(P)H-hydrate epimerase
VIPVVTPAEMAAVDAAASEPVEVLIERAGAAVARAALGLLRGAYGRRVVVVAGKGNNGNDGRAAARRLAARGVAVLLIDAKSASELLPEADLVVDAAYGTGFRGDYDAPAPGGAPVLAVDIPSGVDGLTGAAGDGAVRAVATVTFAALKPGLLLQPGRSRAGVVTVADIGLDVSGARAHVVDRADVAVWLPARPAESHKWKAAVWLVAGSPGMTGAATLAARGAQRGGAGYVRASVPGGEPGGHMPVEVVQTHLPASGWAAEVCEGLGRFKAAVVGPGLGADVSAADVRALVTGAPVPVVVDGDALTALGRVEGPLGGHAPVLTPHDGEFERLTGAAPGADRFEAVRALAATAGCVVLLKGPTTIVAAPTGEALVTLAEDARLATAGTGDVLSGVIAALCAGGLAPFRAAAAGAFLHERAATLGFARGLVAGDVADLLPSAIETLEV